jgi:hypothetical protein
MAGKRAMAKKEAEIFVNVLDIVENYILYYIY